MRWAYFYYHETRKIMTEAFQPSLGVQVWELEGLGDLGMVCSEIESIDAVMA